MYVAVQVKMKNCEHVCCTRFSRLYQRKHLQDNMRLIKACLEQNTASSKNVLAPISLEK